MLTARELQIVQESWEKVVPIADAAAAMFYNRLFEVEPTLRPMFAATTMEEQGRKLMQMMTVAVRGLQRIDQLLPAIEDLGRRHLKYGVTEHHYHVVADVFLWTLATGLGDSFTAELREAWKKAFWALAGVMIKVEPAAA